MSTGNDGPVLIWDVESARTHAQALLGVATQRGKHVAMVGALAEHLVGRAGIPTRIAVAAWLHDVGYASSLSQTGFHPLDGARYLQQQGASVDVVALVAHHTGARFEAEERSRVSELEEMPEPKVSDLDVLTLVDLVVGPTGELTTPDRRIDEILTRYGPEDPVHRAVTRSRAALLAAAERARARLGLSDEWPLDAIEGVLES